VLKIKTKRRYETEFVAIPKYYAKGVLDNLAQYIFQEAKLLCYRKSGELQDSIDMEKIDENTYRVYSGSLYAKAIEYGKRKKDGGRSVAHPFMRPAVKNSKRQMSKISKQEITQAVDDAK
jgi:hypothetical protein